MFLLVNFAPIEIELNSPSIHFSDTKLSRLARLASLIGFTFSKNVALQGLAPWVCYSLEGGNK